MTIRKFLWPSVFVATTILIGCADFPDPDWGPIPMEDLDGKKVFGWGATWQFRSVDNGAEWVTETGTARTTDPGLIIKLETLPTTTYPPSRYYKATVVATTGTLTNAVRTFTTVAGAISAGDEIFDNAGFTSAVDMANRDDLEGWLNSEWISAVDYYALYGS